MEKEGSEKQDATLYASGYSESVYQTALVILGVIVGISIIGYVGLSAFKDESPDSLIAIASAATGGVVAIFARHGKGE